MEITANAIQNVTVNDNVIFTDTPVPGNCSIIHRDGSGIVKLRGLTTTQSRARFKAFFGGNIAVPTGQTPGAIILALTMDGEPVATTRMIATPGAVGQYFNVASSIYLDIPAGCCGTLGVKNVGTIPVDVQNANLIVERIA